MTELTETAGLPAAPLSQVLDDLGHSLPAEGALYIGTLVTALHERGIGALMALFALLVMIPIPGLNTLFCIPLVLLAAQQAFGRHTAWLPQRVMNHKLKRRETLDAIAHILPWLRRVEKILRPRLTWITAAPAAKLFGMAALFMALFASIPVPLTHTVPGLGLLLMAAGTTQQDGLAVAAGAAIGLTYIALIIGAIALFGPHALEMIHNLIRSIL